MREAVGWITRVSRHYLRILYYNYYMYVCSVTPLFPLPLESYSSIVCVL